MSSSSNPRQSPRQGAFFIALGLAAGTAAAGALPVRPHACLIVLSAAVILAAFAVWLRRMRAASLLVIAAFAALGASGAALSRLAAADASFLIRSLVPPEGALARVTGVALENLGPSPAPAGSSRYILRLESIETSGPPVSLSRKAFLDTTADIPFGTAVEVLGWASVPAHAANPGQFDYADYLERSEIALIVRAPGQSLVHTIAAARFRGPRAAAYYMRRRLSSRLEVLELSADGVIPAVILGERSALRDDTREAFVRSGTMHLLAISGLHLGIIAGLLWWLLRFCGISMQRSAALTIVAAAGYTLVVGARPSVVRAALMLSLFCAAVILDRRPRPLSVISTAVIAMLLVDPPSLFDPGFQMSVVAVLGIFYLGAPLGTALSARARKANLPFAAPASSLAAIFGLSLGAWLAVAPLALYHFNVVSLISPLSNLLLIPVTWAMVVAGFLASLVSLISLKAAVPLALAASGARMTLVSAARFLGGTPASCVYLPAPAPWLVAASYAFLAGCAFLAAAGRRIMPLLLAALLAANAAVFAALAARRPSTPEITSLVDSRGAVVVAIDSRRRAAVLIGKSATTYTASAIICPYLLERGITRVELLVETAGADARLRDVLAEKLSVGTVLRQRRFRASDEIPSVAGAVDFGPGDVFSAGEFTVTAHCARPRDFLSPEEPYFEGLIAEINLSGKRAVLALDATGGCLATAGRRIAPGADLVLKTAYRGPDSLYESWIENLAPALSVDALGTVNGYRTASSVLLRTTPAVVRFEPAAQTRSDSL